MKYCPFLLMLLFSYRAVSQNLITEKDIIYGKAVDFRNHSQDLKLDLVHPSNSGKFPLIAFMHGGQFMESSTKEGFLPFCERLAHKGYVVANIEYRRGFTLLSQNYKAEISKAVYRAEQDQHAALRYLLHYAETYHIDTSMVYIAGESAGAVTSLFTAYCPQSDWDRLFPALYLNLGKIDSSGNNFAETLTLRGVIGMWGGIADTALISSEEMNKIPVLLFHSMDDNEIPFEQISNPKANQQLLMGSKDIASRFKNNGGCYRLNYVKSAGHAYGFSGDYITRNIDEFVRSIQRNQCISTNIENPERNITLGLFDSDSAAFPNEDDKIIKLSPENLQSYAGKYMADRFTSIILVEGDHLNAVGPDGQISELYPLGNHLFVQKQFNLRVEFTMDSRGKPNAQIVRLNKNKEMRFKKIG